MLSAFQLENNRLTRLEAEESQPLIDAVWVDLVEPDDDERLRVQSELGQSLATRPELGTVSAERSHHQRQQARQLLGNG